MNTESVSVKQIVNEMSALAASHPNMVADAQLDTANETVQSVARDTQETMAWVQYFAAKIDAGIPLTREQLNDANTVAHRAEAGAYKISLSNPNATGLQKYLLVFARGVNVLLLAFTAATQNQT